jgi:hypothetical protein
VYVLSSQIQQDEITLLAALYRYDLEILTPSAPYKANIYIEPYITDEPIES